MRDLERYRERRDPGRTPEPFGAHARPTPRPPDAPRAFVVQQHAARSLHWDLRLEIDGVLVSWAVPRGPSLDPSLRRLAVRTEDHPLEYADFEGVIPAGNYGAGAMIVWDRGRYRTAKGEAPARGLEAGKLDLQLEGYKLRGRFALVRTRSEGGREWLLLCKESAESGDAVAERPESVYSGLRVEELRDGVSRREEVRAAVRLAPRLADDPRGWRPMLASRGEVPFSREGWLFELKYDGARTLAWRGAEAGAGVRLASRRGLERTDTYPEIARALEHLPLSAFAIDGEVCALDDAGRSSFERLQRRFTRAAPAPGAELDVPVVFYAFDLLAAGGRDLRGRPLAERKRLLSRLLPPRGPVRFADHVEGDGLALFEAAREHGLEGIVAKRADAPYESGVRSRRWLKVKVPRSARLAIVGCVPGRGARRRLGSLMLAWRGDGELVYAGNAGSGLDERTIDALLPRLTAVRRAAPAFRGAPLPTPRGAFYVEPEWVCEVRYTEITGAGLLRHPVFAGLCADASPDGRPEPDPAPAAREPEPAPGAPPAAPGPELRLTRVDKVFWPVEGYTKGDLLAWYEAVWPWIAPYLHDRPVVLTRYPDGIEGKSFYQKNAPEFTPDWALRESIDGTEYFVCNDLRSLLYVVNSGAIPLHVWSARVGSIDRPDWLVLDLDPKQAPFSRVVEVARHLHRLLDALATPHFAKTSGQDGIHVLLPLGGRLGHDDARRLAEVLARVVCAERPDVATVARPLAARADRVYVDYLQNGRGKLIAAPYSVRPRPGAPVSTPLTWRQVTRRLDPRRHSIRTVLPQLRRRGDPLLGLLGEPAEVEALLAALSERLA